MTQNEPQRQSQDPNRDPAESSRPANLASPEPPSKSPASLPFPPEIILHIAHLYAEPTVDEATDEEGPEWPPFAIVRNQALLNLALVSRQFRPCAYAVLYGELELIWLPPVVEALKRTLVERPELAEMVRNISAGMRSKEQFVATQLGAAGPDSDGEWVWHAKHGGDWLSFIAPGQGNPPVVDPEQEEDGNEPGDDDEGDVQQSQIEAVGRYWEGKGYNSWEQEGGPVVNAVSALFDVVQHLPNLDTLSLDQVGDTDSEVPLDENVLSVLGNLEILSYRSSTAVDCRSPTLLDTLLAAVPRLRRLELDVPGRLVAQANTPLLPLLKTLHLTSSTEFLTTEPHPFLRTLVQTLATIDISGSRSESLDSLSNVIATGDLKSLHVNWVTGRGPEEALLAPTAKLRACIAQSHLERLALDFTSSLPFTSIISNLPSTLVSLHLENDDLPVRRPPQYLRTQVAPADLTRILTGVLHAIKGKAGALRVVEYASRIQHWPEEVPEVIEAFRDEGLEGSRSRWRASRGDFSFSFWSAKGPGGRGVGGREGSSSRGCKDGESCCVMNLEPEE